MVERVEWLDRIARAHLCAVMQQQADARRFVGQRLARKITHLSVVSGQSLSSLGGDCLRRHIARRLRIIVDALQSVGDMRIIFARIDRLRLAPLDLVGGRDAPFMRFLARSGDLVPQFLGL